MSLAGCQIIPIDFNFHLQKCLEIFDKIQFKNYKEVNPPCLMPIRVNGTLIHVDFQILGYLGDILEDLGHPLTDNLGCLSRLLRLPIKDVMSSSASEERDFQKIFTQVQKMRNIKL